MTRPQSQRNPLFWTLLALLTCGLSLTTQSHAETHIAPGLDLDGEVSLELDFDDDEHNPLANIPFDLRLDLAKAFDSPLGQMLWDIAQEEKPNLEELMDGVVETIGLDPRTGIGELVLRGQGANEEDIQLIAQLGQTTGKLEGWMLTLPGYDSDDLNDDTLLHSFLVEDDQGHEGGVIPRAWVALPKNADGRFTLVASFNEDATVDLTEDILAGNSIDDAPGLEGDDILALRVDDLGEHGLPEGAPGSAIFESVQTLTLKLGSADDVTASVNMATTSNARARQVSQLLQGMIALGQLVAIEQPEAQPLADFLQNVQVRTDEDADLPAVSASFQSSHEQFADWIEFLADM